MKPRGLTWGDFEGVLGDEWGHGGWVGYENDGTDARIVNPTTGNVTTGEPGTPAEPGTSSRAPARTPAAVATGAS